MPAATIATAATVASVWFVRVWAPGAGVDARGSAGCAGRGAGSGSTPVLTPHFPQNSASSDNGAPQPRHVVSMGIGSPGFVEVMSAASRTILEQGSAGSVSRTTSARLTFLMVATGCAPPSVAGRRYKDEDAFAHRWLNDAGASFVVCVRPDSVDTPFSPECRTGRGPCRSELRRSQRSVLRPSPRSRVAAGLHGWEAPRLPTAER